jgi:hypothetical protein
MARLEGLLLTMLLNHCETKSNKSPTNYTQRTHGLVELPLAFAFALAFFLGMLARQIPDKDTCNAFSKRYS